MFNKGEQMSYDEQACDTGPSVGGLGLMRAQAVKMPTYTQRVDQAVIDAEERLKDLKRMKEIFAKHPEFEELLTLVQRGRV